MCKLDEYSTCPGFREDYMQKLQIFVFKLQDSFKLALLRNPSHQADMVPEDQVGPGVALSPPLVSSDAYSALELWESRFRGKMRLFWWQLLSWRQGRQRPETMGFSQSDSITQDLVWRIEEILAGRILSEQRLAGLLRQEGFWPSDISRALDRAVDGGQITQLPGFIKAPWGQHVCSRCQGEYVEKAPCLRCGKGDCLRCVTCSSMGEHRACSTLLALPHTQRMEPLERIKPQLKLDYDLTFAQQQASKELLQFWQDGQGKALVWAACGAGKTEVTFALIQRALSAGGQVLFAIPRQDIVREMTERLQAAFPSVTVASHYGGQPWFAPGKLVVATTHQVLHFYRRFSLAILDEVDAFPYQGNEMLRFGIQRALLPQGKLVEMTATPNVRREYKRVITIPARYHGFPLPEPELVVSKLQPWVAMEANDLPHQLVDNLQGAQGPWLVFAPTIAACSRLRSLLSQALERPVGLCHSKVEHRAAVIKQFRDGDLDIMVTTSVLERGVTFPGVGVIVLYADHAVFNVSALVQIAGRVGRTAKAPRGTVLFLASRLSASMKQARQLIQELNREARERGLLTSEETP